MKKVTQAVLLVIAFAFCLMGCAKDEGVETSSCDKGVPKSVSQLVKSYYDSIIAGEYNAAIDVMYFPEGTDELEELYTDFSSPSLLQSYSIYEITELTPELYSVNVVGVQLSRVAFVYDENGDISGMKEPEDGRHWYVQSLDRTHYVAYVDEDWKFCVTSKVVPPGMYEFEDEATKVIMYGNSDE